MTPAETVSPAASPGSRSNWLKIVLVVSLAVNLLFIGGGVARYLTHGTPERMSGISQMQLIPRKFLGELDRPRRAELMSVFKQFAISFRKGRKAARDEVFNLASALEAEPYDAARVSAAVDAFSSKSLMLVEDGGRAAIALISKLTPGERQLLAKHIRLRDSSGRKRGSSGEKD